MKYVLVLAIVHLIVGVILATPTDCLNCDASQKSEICAKEQCCDVCPDLCSNANLCSQKNFAIAKKQQKTNCVIDCVADVPARFVPECVDRKRHYVYFDVGHYARSMICPDKKKDKDCECYKFYAQDHPRNTKMAFKSSPDYLQQVIIEQCRRLCTNSK